MSEGSFAYFVCKIEKIQRKKKNKTKVRETIIFNIQRGNFIDFGIAKDICKNDIACHRRVVPGTHSWYQRSDVDLMSSLDVIESVEYKKKEEDETIN